MDEKIVASQRVSRGQRTAALACGVYLVGACLIGPLTGAAWGDILPPARESAEKVAKRKAAADWLPIDYLIIGGLVLAAFEGFCVVGLVKTRRRFLKKAEAEPSATSSDRG
ncbi:MAG: hypothetical protein AB1646_13905 [Thermodesulfobacteriota bacterium]